MAAAGKRLAVTPVVEVLLAAMEAEPVVAGMAAMPMVLEAMVVVLKEDGEVVKSLFMNKLVRCHMYQIYIYFC